MKQIVAVFVVLLLLPLTTSAQIILDIENGYGLPGQTNSLVSVNLNNPVDEISGVQVSICDVDDYLYCTGCETTERTSGFLCVCSEVDGCANVILLDLGGDVFARGSGPIFTLAYEVSPLAPLGECRVLHPESLNVADENTVPIDGRSLLGKFYICREDCECEGNFDGDEDQDGSDAFDFKVDFGRSPLRNPCEIGNPCNGDFDCDNDCDGSDAFTFKEDFGRSPLGNPCPTGCDTVPWCAYL
jgi:hypothetical protein